MGQVFHAHDATHKRVIEHCKTNGLGVKAFVDTAVHAALDGRAPVKVEPVGKKRGVEFTTDKGEGPKPWELPPFWERKGKVEPVEATPTPTPDPAPEDEEDEEPLQRESVAPIAAAIGEPYVPVSQMKLIGGG